METTERRQIRWYEVMYVLILLALLVMSVFFMNPHRVGVLDVDRVFKEVGMVQRVEKDRKNLEVYNRGTAMVQAYNQRMAGLKQKMDAAKTQPDKDKIQAQIKSSTELFQQTIVPIQQGLQSHEAGVIGTFRRRLQPYVAETAQKRGLDVVMYVGPNLIYVRNKVDITADVIAKSKAYFAKEMPLVDPALLPPALGAPIGPSK